MDYNLNFKTVTLNQTSIEKICTKNIWCNLKNYEQFHMLNIKYSMVPPPFTGGRGDESLMFKSPVRMTSSNSDFFLTL